jgi:uncharacterized protein YicC (UPF0701 family)
MEEWELRKVVQRYTTWAMKIAKLLRSHVGKLKEAIEERFIAGTTPRRVELETARPFLPPSKKRR